MSRLFSSVFVFLMIGGGGDLPTLDGFLFHSRGNTLEVARPHVEAAGGCHAERCTIRATAQPSRFAPDLATIAVVLAEPRAVLRLPSRLIPPSRPVARPSSRAPPVSSRV